MSEDITPQQVNLSIVSSHFSRVAEFFKNEALALALGLEKATAMTEEQKKVIEFLTPKKEEK